MAELLPTDEEHEKAYPDDWAPDESLNQSLTLQGIRINGTVHSSIQAIIKSLKGIKPHITNEKASLEMRASKYLQNPWLRMVKERF